MGWATRWDYPSFFLRTCATAACTGRAGAEATKRASSLPEETWRCNGWMELRVTKRHQRYLSRIDQCCPFRALRGLVWVDVSANRVATVHTNAPLCNRRLTERRILDGRRHGKAQSGRATSRKGAFWAGDATSTSRKSAFCVWASPKGALCMRAGAQSAPFREVAGADCAFT